MRSLFKCCWAICFFLPFSFICSVSHARNLIYVGDLDTPNVSVYDSETQGLLETLDIIDTDSVVPDYDGVNGVGFLQTNSLRTRLFVGSSPRSAPSGLYWPWDTGSLSSFEVFEMALASNGFQHRREREAVMCTDDVYNDFDMLSIHGFANGGTPQSTLLVAGCDANSEVSWFWPGETGSDDSIESSDGSAVETLVDDPFRLANAYITTNRGRAERLTYFSTGLRLEESVDLSNRPIAMEVNALGTKLMVLTEDSVLHILSIPHLQLLSSIALRGPSVGLVIHSRLPKAYVLTRAAIKEINIDTFQEERTVPHRLQFVQNIKSSETTDMLYVLRNSELTFDGEIVMYEIAGLQETGRIPLQRSGNIMVVGKDFPSRHSALTFAAALRIDRPGVDWTFTQVPLQRSRLKKTLWLTNIGGRTLTLNRLNLTHRVFSAKAAFSGPGSGLQQTSDPGYCRNTLGSLSSCKIDVECNPNSIADYSGSLEIWSNSTPSVTRVELSCRGLVGPNLRRSPRNVNLVYDENNPSPVSGRISLMNDGNQPLQFSSFVLLPTRSSVFSMQENCTNRSIPVNGSCVVAIQCNPTGTSAITKGVQSSRGGAVSSTVSSTTQARTHIGSIVTLDNTAAQTHTIPLSCAPLQDEFSAEREESIESIIEEIDPRLLNRDIDFSEKLKRLQSDGLLYEAEQVDFIRQYLKDAIQRSRSDDKTMQRLEELKF